MCYSKKTSIFAPAIQQGAIAQLVEQRTENPCVPGSIPGGTTCESNRDVAQLVAHYVRDVGVGRSSRLIPTENDNRIISVAVFVFFEQMTIHLNNIPFYTSNKSSIFATTNRLSSILGLFYHSLINNEKDYTHLFYSGIHNVIK